MKVALDELMITACCRETVASMTTTSAWAPSRPMMYVGWLVSIMLRTILPPSNASSRGRCITGSLDQSGGRHRRGGGPVNVDASCSVAALLPAASSGYCVFGKASPPPPSVLG